MTNVYHKSPEIIAETLEERADELSQTIDDLTEIKGIGLGTVEKLNAMKIYTYRQLAELTPEKLSEAPGIGIATARKFIEEAKNLLGEFQEQKSVNKQNHLIEKTTEILKKEKETEVDNIETFEVAEVIVEEELPQEKLQIKEKPIETIQKPWFNDKFNYSRLTASHPTILERSSKESKVEIEEIEEIEEQPQEQIDNIFNEESFVVEKPKSLEEDSREETSFVPEISEIFEVENVPKISKIRDKREETKTKIEKSLKNLGYYEIPNTLEALIPFFQNIDYIWSKLVSVNNNLKLIFLVPIKLCDLDGTILVDEEKIGYKAYSKAQRSDSVLTVNHYTNNLLRIQDAIFEDIVKGDKFRNFFQKYLQVRFTAEKSVKNKTLFFVSGLTQYKILIEPILLTKIPAKCLEKSILFPYQRKTNLHVIERSKITTLLRFLEKKYKLIESRDKRTNSIELYQNADNKFRSSLRMASLPFLGYSVVLFVIYFSQLHFLLRLFNNIGFATMGIYLFIIAYFYFKFYQTKKELTTEFKTPYYLQSAQFSETDLLYIKEEFTDEQMAQFGYECFGKDNNSKVLEQIEKDNIKENIVKKQQEKDIPQLYELDSEPEYSSINKPKHEIKYSSFLED
jgi:hypothetical protein